MLYRANRLAPVALNLPETCTTLGEHLNALISAYWDSEPTTDVHFLIEADRFCKFLRKQADLPPSVRPLLEREHAIIAAKLTTSRNLASVCRTHSDQSTGSCHGSPGTRMPTQKLPLPILRHCAKAVRFSFIVALDATRFL